MGAIKSTTAPLLLPQRHKDAKDNCPQNTQKLQRSDLQKTAKIRVIRSIRVQKMAIGRSSGACGCGGKPLGY